MLGSFSFRTRLSSISFHVPNVDYSLDVVDFGSRSTNLKFPSQFVHLFVSKAGASDDPVIV